MVPNPNENISVATKRIILQILYIGLTLIRWKEIKNMLCSGTEA